MAKRGPRVDKETRSTTHVILSRLIYRGRANPNDPRIQARALVNALETGERSGAESEKRSSLKKHLNGRLYPSLESAWEYGEQLRSLGIPWCSGLWMLWATERYADVIATFAIWLRENPDQTTEMFDAIWHAVALSNRLASPTGLDRNFDFLRRHLRQDRLSVETYEAIWNWAKAYEPYSIVRGYISFLDREAAKTPWLMLIPKMGEFQAAFDRWLSTGRTFSAPNPLDQLALTSIKVAESNIRLPERETVTLVMFGQWLAGVELKTQVPLYVRAIDHRYDTPLPKLFGTIPDSLPSLTLQGLT